LLIQGKKFLIQAYKANIREKIKYLEEGYFMLEPGIIARGSQISIEYA